MRFDDLKLMPLLLQNVQAAGYETPTPIQQATIPLVLAGKDVLGCAQTGTGKTAAFALPIIQQLAKKPTRFGQSRAIRALILTPTRELAQQIYDNFVLYGKKLPVYPTVIFGGVNQQGQVNALHRGADVVIACPGRLWDLMNQGFVHLDKVETFVLDEADRMLDMGFIHDVRRIAEKLPEKRQTLMFSATMPPEVEKLAMDLLHEPESVKVDPVSSTVKKIDQCLYYVDKANKKHLLAKILRDPDVENALVFSRTKHGADRIVRDLKREGIDVMLADNKIDAFIQTHEHMDHYWGFPVVTKYNPNIHVYTPNTFYPAGKEYLKACGHVGKWTEVPKGLHTLQPGVALYQFDCPIIFKVFGEMSLYCNVKDVGLVSITGCCHQGIILFADTAYKELAYEKDQFYGLYGGLHISPFDDWDPKYDDLVIGLKKWNLQQVGCNHCTGLITAQKFVDAGYPVVKGTARFRSKTTNYLGNGDVIKFPA